MKNKLKKRVFIMFITLFCIGIVGVIYAFSINYYVVASTKNQILTSEEAAKLSDVDCILVLGALVKPNGMPSHMLQDRIITGIKLYELGASAKLIMSGDHGREGYDEVNTMKEYAINEGLPSEDIFMDHAGFSTYESIYRAKEVFGADKIIIVTQEYHLYRALYIANVLGVEAYGVSADLRDYAGQFKRDIREILARNKDFIYGIIKPEPKYLGDSIPVSGDGNITNDK